MISKMPIARKGEKRTSNPRRPNLIIAITDKTIQNVSAEVMEYIFMDL